jgi:hypothetical protein
MAAPVGVAPVIVTIPVNPSRFGDCREYRTGSKETGRTAAPRYTQCSAVGGYCALTDSRSRCGPTEPTTSVSGCMAKLPPN